jgi:hypothetical protein
MNVYTKLYTHEYVQARYKEMHCIALAAPWRHRKAEVLVTKEREETVKTSVLKEVKRLATEEEEEEAVRMCIVEEG